MTLKISSDPKFSIRDFETVIFKNPNIELTPGVLKKLEDRYHSLHRLLKSKKNPVYGIHTGFGTLQNIRTLNNWARHQRELVVSHACGVGQPMSALEVRAMIYLRCLELARAYSAINPSTLREYLKLLTRGPLPQIPSQGSVGACGDLIPLAHAASAVLKKLPDHQIGPRDGLALINGTEASSAVALLAAFACQKLFHISSKVTALSLFASYGKSEAWDLNLVNLKKHKDSASIAAGFNLLLGQYKNEGLPQDPYCLRAAPQITGCAWSLIEKALKMLIDEANSVTDNPVFLARNNTSERPILHGANFHGIYIAVAADMLAWSLHLLAQASERRVDHLLSGSRGLPKMLSKSLGSGLMMTQVVQAALLAETRMLTMPASALSSPTNLSQEDVVPMSMNAALKLKKVLRNFSRIVAIETIAGLRAVSISKRVNDLKNKTKLNELWQECIAQTGTRVLEKDVQLDAAIEKLAASFIAPYLSSDGL